MPITKLPLSDPWAGLNHKAKMETAERSQSIPPWVPTTERRRLTAYEILDAYATNNARTLLPFLDDVKEAERAQAWQELGDVGLMITRIADAIVGEDPQVSIVGADSPLADGPDLPEAPRRPVRGDMSEQAYAKLLEIWERRIELWEQQVDEEFARWEGQVQRQPELSERQRQLRDWATREGFIRKLVEMEKRNVVRHGDGVAVLGWDDDRQRPTVEVYDPGSYFPVLDDTRPSEFPTRVHLAWQIHEPDGRGGEEIWVRRITYELLRREEALARGIDEGERPRYLPPAPTPREIQEGARDAWTHIVVMSDGRWKLSDFSDRTLDSIEDAAVWREVFVNGEFVELREYPLGWDMIPVVHVTHDLAGQTHFGTSPIAVLAQLLDELQAADTDASLASRRAARPTPVIKGMAQQGGTTKKDRARNNAIDWSPGRAVLVGENGGVDVIDMAQALASVLEYVRRLLKRLSVNGSVTEGLIGRVDASEVPSGRALDLSFTSFEQMIEGARLARSAAYKLLLKFVQRIQIHNGGGYETLADTEDGAQDLSVEVMDAEVVFGNFMPQDLQGTIQLVSAAVQSHVMSIQTAIKMLEESGVPVDDIRSEFAAILSVWGDLAVDVAQSTGDERLAASILGFIAEDDDADVEPEPVEPAGTDLTGVGAAT